MPGVRPRAGTLTLMHYTHARRIHTHTGKETPKSRYHVPSIKKTFFLGNSISSRWAQELKEIKRTNCKTIRNKEKWIKGQLDRRPAQHSLTRPNSWHRTPKEKEKKNYYERMDAWKRWPYATETVGLLAMTSYIEASVWVAAPVAGGDMERKNACGRQGTHWREEFRDETLLLPIQLLLRSTPTRQQRHPGQAQSNETRIVKMKKKKIKNNLKKKREGGITEPEFGKTGERGTLSFDDELKRSSFHGLGSIA